MTSTMAAILLFAFAQTPVSNGDNANQVRASIYEIALGNQRGTVAPQEPSRRRQVARTSIRSPSRTTR